MLKTRVQLLISSQPKQMISVEICRLLATNAIAVQKTLHKVDVDKSSESTLPKCEI
jgi:hypothetical protein